MKYLEPNENYWSLDVEGNGLKPTILWVVCVENIVTGEKLSFRNAQQFNDWNKPEYVFVAFNGIHYDFPALRNLWGADIPVSRVIDPFILSQYYDAYLEGGHSLKSWGFRVKLEKIDFHEFDNYSPEMDTYCGRDTTICRRVYIALSKRFRDRGDSEQSLWIEHHFAEIIERQQRNGFQFDIAGAEKLYNELRQREAELGASIGRYFPPELKSVGVYEYRTKKDGEPFAYYLRHTERFPKVEHRSDGTYECFDYEAFNPGSPAQRLKRLLAMGFKPTKKTKSGGWATGEEVVLDFFEETKIPELEQLANWLVYNGRANMINNWLENVDRNDSRIHGGVFSCGAGSRRARHTSPNTANIPSTEARFGTECRSLWTASPDRVLVGIDAAGLEGRILVHWLGVAAPERLQAAYDYIIDTQAKYNVKDFHTLNAQQITKHVIPKDRKPCKNDFYALIFGAQDPKLGAMSGGDEELGAKIRKVLERAVPGLGELVEYAHKEFEDNGGLLRAVDGGFVRCPSIHAAVNYKCQPAGAVVMKLASILHDRDIKKNRWDALKVGDIHDEVIFDVPDKDTAKAVGQSMVDSIVKAGQLLKMKVPLDGEYKIGLTWAETH